MTDRRAKPCPMCGDAGSLFPSDNGLTLVCDFCDYKIDAPKRLWGPDPVATARHTRFDVGITHRMRQAASQARHHQQPNDD